MLTVRKALTTGFVLLAGVLFAAVPAAPASAATPHCSIAIVYDDAFMPGSIDVHPRCNMGQGSQSNAVVMLQASLNACYQRGLAEDGKFGPLTKAALKWVQKNRLHVTDDGVYGPITGNAMEHRIVGGGGTCKRVAPF